MDNVYLIGMPGSGKSALGAALAQALHRPFVDVDAAIEQQAGCSIPRIFAERGEAAFRDMERDALQNIAQTDGQVIATGGGIVLDARSVRRMRDTGTVLWIDRPLAHLQQAISSQGRPLLAGDAAQRLRILHEQRLPLYQAAAHLRLDNAADLPAVLECALALLRRKSELN